MRRTLIRILAMLLSATPCVALAEADLVPLPWTGAGFSSPEGTYTSTFGDAPIALTQPVTAVYEIKTCFVSPGGGILHLPPSVVCSTPTPQVATFDGGSILIATTEFQFQATLASVVSANRWTVELLNPSLSMPKPGVTGQVPDGSVISLHIFIDAFPSATFFVPDVSPAPTEAVTFRALPSVPPSPGRLPLVEARSARLAESLVPFTPGFLEPFLDGDTVSVLGRASFQVSFDALYFPISVDATVAGTSFGIVDPCGSATSTAALPVHACKIGMELLEANPKTSVASLACRADLNQDGVVNFQDLARMKSVFFQACTP